MAQMKNYNISFKLIGEFAILLSFSGCQRAPSFDIFGSFFPVWFLCIVGGILSMLVCRHFLIQTGLDHEIGPLVIIYPCLTAFFSFLLWLTFFGQ